MSEHSLGPPEAPVFKADVVEEPPVPETLVEDRRTLWSDFGKLLLGNVLAIAVVLILMAIFLV